MTDKEIIKALECCGEENKCQQCPYYNKGNFKCLNYKFFKDLLYLINRQQAEIERLEKLTKDRADVNFDKIVRVVDRARADIKAEAIEEFSGRLYDAFSKMQREYRKVLDNSGADAMLIVQKVLKYYKKEMVGEDK